MYTVYAAFSSFSADDLAKAKEFYKDVLGLKLLGETMGLNFELPGGGKVFIYQKPDHQPANFTVLNLVVDSIDTAVDDLVTKGAKFEVYTDMPAPPDEKGIMRGLAANQGPDIAWLKDPAGNIVSVMQDK